MINLIYLLGLFGSLEWGGGGASEPVHTGINDPPEASALVLIHPTEENNMRAEELFSSHWRFRV